MVFSSLLFLFCFFPIVLIVYFLCPRRGRNLCVFLSSLIFYAWGEPVYVVLMLFSTWLDYMLGARVDQCKEKGDMRGARRAVITSAVINLSMLGIFKYSDFIIGNINTLTGLQLPLPQLALPIGISFYTFQTMSYTIDIYRGEAKRQYNYHCLRRLCGAVPAADRRSDCSLSDGGAEMMGRKENMMILPEDVSRFMVGPGQKGSAGQQYRCRMGTGMRSGDRESAGIVSLDWNCRL